MILLLIHYQAVFFVMRSIGDEGLARQPGDATLSPGEKKMRTVSTTHHKQAMPPAGILLRDSGSAAIGLMDRLQALDLASYIATTTLPANQGTLFQLAAASVDELAPDASTSELSGRLGLDPAGNADDLERVILLSLMLSPIRFEYRNYGELASAVNVRRNIVSCGRKTFLAFDTTRAAERPADCWTFSEESGFTVLPGKPLIEALRKATQPEVSGCRYAFSCYRASEYVILLAIAEELEKCNPALLHRLQRQWETKAIKSGAFHHTFLIEYGSMAAPLPLNHYVPGDRLWFRNPDDRSSDVDGYEGSWVFYLGDGQFTNFWKANQPYTLTSKCLEIYHWRNGVYIDREGQLRMDEAVVDERVRASLANPDEVQEILGQMMRLRDPQGVYISGGCIDASREYPRSLYPGATEFMLPYA